MIAKITRSRGSAVGLAAYLHGPGKGTEHRWTDQDGRQHVGGIVVSSSVPGQEGATSGRTWARWMDRATRARPDIRSAPLWHCSLNLAPHDRRLSAEEWRGAAVQFLDAMGVPDTATWVAVQHDDRGIHLVVGRITDDGLVWDTHNDYRRAQKARQALEAEYGLHATPITKAGGPAPLGPLPLGRVEAGGDVYRVREVPPAKPGGAPVQAVDKMGRDGRWRSLSRGARTLSNLLAWEDRKAAGNRPLAGLPSSRLHADADDGRRRLAELEAEAGQAQRLQADADRAQRQAADVQRATVARAAARRQVDADRVAAAQAVGTLEHGGRLRDRAARRAAEAELQRITGRYGNRLASHEEQQAAVDAIAPAPALTPDQARRAAEDAAEAARRAAAAAGQIPALIDRLEAAEAEQLLRRAMRPAELAADEAAHRPAAPHRHLDTGGHYLDADPLAAGADDPLSRGGGWGTPPPGTGPSR